VRGLIPCLPEVAQPLFEALIGEINQMIERTQRRARQNQMLLSRACSVMEQVLRTIQPQSLTKTYSPRGSVSIRGTSVGSCMRASG
jgi:flagellar biosynthesis/type III secretory pathway chaperone